MRLPDVAADVLRDVGPMRIAELLVEIRERGYRTEDEPRLMLKSLTSALERNPTLFRRDNAKRWAAPGTV